VSTRHKRVIVIACVTIAAAALAVNVALAISGHPGRYAVPACVVDSIGVVCGLLYLRSTRGRP